MSQSSEIEEILKRDYSVKEDKNEENRLNSDIWNQSWTIFDKNKISESQQSI